jgi:hypothetical protein
MAKELLNEAERFLVERWGEALLLEQSMKRVRAKYAELFERIIESVTEDHRELNLSGFWLTQSWTSGEIAFGRKSWPNKANKYPCGFWVNELRFDQLAVEESDPPEAYLWILKEVALDYDTARAIVEKAAKDLLNREELKGTEPAQSDDRALFYFTAPSKSELLRLFCDGDGEGFVEMFVSLFDVMARFVPVLDKVFSECLKKE